MNTVVRFGFCILFVLLLSTGVQGYASHSPTISMDGRYAAFDSGATDLVPGDTNGMIDVFVRDRQTGSTWLVSKSSAGTQGNGNSWEASVSSGGRYVAFYSQATNLVAGDANGATDVFVRDRQTGTTWLVSKSSAGAQGDDQSFNPSISADGRYIAFDSYASNLVSGDTNAVPDIFMRDRQTGTTWLLSKSSAGVAGNGNSFTPSVSADGRYVAFYSAATNLVAGDTNGMTDIFIRDRQTGTTWLLSKNSAGTEGNGHSYNPALSSGGRYVAFYSAATNLVAGDTNGMTDIFVRDRQSGTTWLVSKSSAGVLGNGYSYNPTLSSDGRYVAFDSSATNLVAGDTNGQTDIFVRDRQSGTTWLVSKSSGGAQGDNDSMDPTLSADGRYVSFESYATNLVAGDTNGLLDVFVRDRQTGTTTLVSKS